MKIPVEPLAGFRFVESPYCVIRAEEIILRRWRERWFTWPWRPWVGTRRVTDTVPDPELYQVGNTFIVGHPETIAKVKAKLEWQG